MSYKGTYTDVKIYFKNGGSVIVSHEVFIEIISTLKIGVKFYYIQTETQLDGLVPVGLISLNEISHTTPSFTRDNV